jgi:hypothetical protein
VESVPATRTVHRTVRVAVALVVGQALLCALIGYLTLGHARGSGHDDQVADPPLVSPPAATSGSASPSASATTLTGTSRATRKARDLATARTSTAPPPAPPAPAPPAAAPPVTAEPPPDTLIATTPPTPSPVATTTSSPPLEGLIPPRPTTGTPSTDVQQPVTIGDRCAPEGASGKTAEGTAVRCLRTAHYRPRWKIA